MKKPRGTYCPEHGLVYSYQDKDSKNIYRCHICNKECSVKIIQEE